MHRQVAALLLLALLLTGCSRQPSRPAEADAGFCLRAGQAQQFDCRAPALDRRRLQDPLAIEQPVSDEALMDLLAEVKRWLARRRLQLQGQPIPPELQPSPAAAAVSPPPTPARLARPWALILDDFSPASLQRTNPPPR